MRSTLCNPAFGVDSNGCCAGCSAVRHDDTFVRRLQRSASKDIDESSAATTNKKVLSIDQTRVRGKVQLKQVRANVRILSRLQAGRDNWKRKFEHAMAAAASVVYELQSSAEASVFKLLDTARTKETELAVLMQASEASRQQAERNATALCAAHADGARTLAELRKEAAVQLAEASRVEALHVELMRRTGEGAVASFSEDMDVSIAHHEKELQQLEQDLESEFASQLAKVRANTQTELSSFPNYIQNLMTAEKLGYAEEHPACVDIISGIANSLAKNTTRGRRLNETEKQFYAILLNSQSPWAHKFVSYNLMGPNVRYIKQLRTERTPEIAMAVGEAAVRDVLLPLLIEHGLHGIPGGVCEDGTSCNKRLEWELREPASEPAIANPQQRSRPRTRCFAKR